MQKSAAICLRAVPGWCSGLVVLPEHLLQKYPGAFCCKHAPHCLARSTFETWSYAALQDKGEKTVSGQAVSHDIIGGRQILPTMFIGSQWS